MKKTILLFVLCFVFQMFGFGYCAQNSVEKAPVQVFWGTYMNKLQERIYSHWTPDKETAVANKTIVSFKVMKDGNIEDLKILKSSESPKHDEAALSAVEKASPFEPLPLAFKGEYVPVEFSFDNAALSSTTLKSAKKIYQR